ncbi:putative porin [Salegentibacter sp. F188]|uniref:Porin n=1 Tax=Autumnicola patrickiae TaxID=3075591 RepID=A0ABU3E0B7_9FLAO|nr:putative porin [Salegentibacter sp. F188]MDT0689434.1 putative porin [Salegentibacter sp. F188]
MKQAFFTLIFVFTSLFSQAQERTLSPTGNTQGEPGAAQADSVAVPPIDLFQIISYDNDTTYVDTTLNIKKDYRFNYLRKDNFELLPFSNTAQPYTSLSHNPEFNTIMPQFGAQARHFGFFETEDISYYRVPTPLTELYFKTVPEQGQQLDAFFTINTSDRLNFSVAYKGVRALGKFQHILTSTGIFRTTANYQTANNKYQLRTHFVSQNLLNEENGGLSDQALEQYLNEEEEFDDRSLLDVRFENAESTLHGKRFYLDHKYFLTNPASDSLNSLSVGHVFKSNYRKFHFSQESAAPDFFGKSFETTNLRDETRLQEVYNEANVNFRNNILGEFKFRAGFNRYNYGYNSIYVLENQTITNRLMGSVVSVGGEYKKNIQGFNLDAEASLNIGGDLSGNFLRATASYALNEENQIEFGFNQSSRNPNYNFLLYQSDYINYNWQNDFDNINSQNLHFKIDSKKLFNATANLTQIQNHTYFELTDAGVVKPFQYGDQVRYLKVKAERELEYGKFGMYHTLMYQNVFNGADVLKLPDFVTRNSFYYQDHWFQKALYLQTGFTFKYFSKYEMNGYDSVLGEFFVQNQQNLGGFPVVDFFFNGKVQQTRIFFKLEHLNSLITGNTHFSAPGYPYTDFLVRFGLVWNFFM